MCTQAEAKKLTRQELTPAEETLKTHGEVAVFRKRALKHAYAFQRIRGREKRRSETAAFQDRQIARENI